MLGLLFVLLAAVGLAIGLVLPAGAVAGYLAVLAWVAIILYLIFYGKDPVSRGLENLNRRRQNDEG